MTKLKFTKEELIDCSDETFEKLRIHLPECNKDVHLNIGTDNWGVNYISYGADDEMVELVNLILSWKFKAENGV